MNGPVMWLEDERGRQISHKRSIVTKGTVGFAMLSRCTMVTTIRVVADDGLIGKQTTNCRRRVIIGSFTDIILG